MEEIEVPTDHLHEAIEEKAEEVRERWTLYVALSTAFMAVLAAVAGLLAGHHANEALIERVKASDEWNYYQSKNIKEEVAVNSDKLLHALAATRPAASAGSTAALPEDNAREIAKFEKDKEEGKKKAEEAEKSSEWHLGKHVPLASAVTAFQIAIAISAIAILTRRKPLWYGGLLLTCVGIFFLVQGLLP
ncbi:MAG: DUF4337 family protein [Bacteroidota bacterium]|nr:DUF4337 family protein [Bacteroidota bacterium]